MFSGGRTRLLKPTVAELRTWLLKRLAGCLLGPLVGRFQNYRIVRSNRGVTVPRGEHAHDVFRYHEPNIQQLVISAIHRAMRNLPRVGPRLSCSMTEDAGAWPVSILLVLLCLVICPRANAQRLPPGTTFRDCLNCPEMVVIPAGTFLMGSSIADTERDLAAPDGLGSFEKDYLNEEHPQHQVRIGQPFDLGKYLVTRSEYAAFVQATGYTSAAGCIFYHRHNRIGFAYHGDGSWQNPGFPQTDRDPVVCVSWWDAQAYVNWLNTKLQGGAPTNSGGRYRLPSEAEWEYAARAWQQTARWWGANIGTNNADCDGCGSRWDDKGTAPVGSFKPNQFGLYDMLGNAGEWTQDCWQPDYRGAPSDGTALRYGDCGHRAVRGRAWNSETWTVRSSARFGLNVDQAYSYVGFRVAKTLP